MEFLAEVLPCSIDWCTKSSIFEVTKVLLIFFCSFRWEDTAFLNEGEEVALLSNGWNEKGTCNEPSLAVTIRRSNAQNIIRARIRTQNTPGTIIRTVDSNINIPKNQVNVNWSMLHRIGCMRRISVLRKNEKEWKQYNFDQFEILSLIVLHMCYLCLKRKFSP